MAYLLLIFSSFIGMIMELVWIRKISFLFGNFYFSTAIIFAALFAGYTAGSYFSSKNLKNGKNALKRFGLYNIIALAGIITAYLIFNYTPFFSFFYNLLFLKSVYLFRIFQFFVVCILLFPWSFCYGCVFPLISAIYFPANLPKKYLFIYLVFSTSGLAGLITGAFFILPQFGLTATFVLACAVYALLGIMSLFASKQSVGTSDEIPDSIHAERPDFSKGIIAVLSAVAGFCSMGFELLVLRSVNLVDNNSFYSFSISLAVILFSFIIGTVVVAVLSKCSFLNKKLTMPLFFLGSMVVLTAIPFVFVIVTDGILPFQNSTSWFGYLLNVIRVLGLVALIPGIFLGALVPLLIEKVRESKYSIGTLLAFNTLGVTLAIFFVEIPSLSLWKSMWFTGILCGLSSILLCIKTHRTKLVLLPISITMIILIMFVSVNVPTVWKNATLRNMKVIEEQFGGGVAALIADSRTAHILVNNQYSIGSNQNVYEKQMQSLLPLALHPASEKICFVGMGTGITAGAALKADPASIVICEISSGVEKLAKKYFVNYVNGLFDDKRVKIHIEDGRAYLTHANEKFDLVISELFIPWQSGTAALYTKEFYQIVCQRLENDGIFVQWLPFYQLTMDDFGIIAATLNNVFGQVTMWRSDYNVNSPVIALVCSREKTIFFPDNAVKNDIMQSLKLSAIPYENQPAMTSDLLQYYCGNITENANLFNKYRLNTDDLLPIEYTSPKTHILYSRSDKLLTGGQYINLCQMLLKNTPLQHDPYLSKVTNELGLVGFGLREIEKF